MFITAGPETLCIRNKPRIVSGLFANALCRSVAFANGRNAPILNLRADFEFELPLGVGIHSE